VSSWNPQLQDFRRETVRKLVLTRRTRHSRTLTLLHDLEHLRRVRHIVLGETLDVDSSVLLLVDLKVVVVG